MTIFSSSSTFFAAPADIAGCWFCNGEQLSSGDQRTRCVFYVRQEVLLFRLRMKHAGGERERREDNTAIQESNCFRANAVACTFLSPHTSRP